MAPPAPFPPKDPVHLFTTLYIASHSFERSVRSLPKRAFAERYPTDFSLLSTFAGVSASAAPSAAGSRRVGVLGGLAATGAVSSRSFFRTTPLSFPTLRERGAFPAGLAGGLADMQVQHKSPTLTNLTTTFEPGNDIYRYCTRQKPVGKRPGKKFDFATFIMS